MENQNGKIPVSSGDSERNYLMSFPPGFRLLISFPPGFRFKPSDQECINYLNKKVAGAVKFPGRIHEVDIYKHPPQELDNNYRLKGEKETYFFSPRNRKYPNGSRPDRRVAGFGYWKATGIDTSIEREGQLIGYKMTLVFHTGQAKEKNQSEKTNWSMHEFTLPEGKQTAKSKNKLASSSAPPPNMKLNDWVLCKIYDNSRTLKVDERRRQDAEVVTVPVNNEEVQNPIEQSQIMTNQHSQSEPSMMMPIDAVNPAMPGCLTSGRGHGWVHGIPTLPLQNNGFPTQPLPNNVAHLSPQGGSVYPFPLPASMEYGSMPLMPHMQSSFLLPPIQLQPTESGSMLPVPQPMGNGSVFQMQSMESDSMLSNHNNPEPLHFNFPCNYGQQDYFPCNNGQQDYHPSTSQFSLDPFSPNDHSILDSSLPNDHSYLDPFLPNDHSYLDPFLPNDHLIFPLTHLYQNMIGPNSCEPSFKEH